MVYKGCGLYGYVRVGTLSPISKPLSSLKTYSTITMSKLIYTHKGIYTHDKDKCTPFEGCVTKYGQLGKDASDMLDCISSQLDSRDDTRVAITTSISSMGKTTLWKKMTTDYPELAKDVTIHPSPYSFDDEEAYTSKLYTTLFPIRKDVDLAILLSPKTDDVYREFMKRRDIEKPKVEEYIRDWRKLQTDIKKHMVLDIEKPFIEIEVDIEE